MPKKNIEEKKVVENKIQEAEKIVEKVNNVIPSISKYMLIPGSDIFNNQSHYIQSYKTKFHYTNHWKIPKCSRITSSMVDPSAKMNYLDIISNMSEWIPTLYSTCIKRFTKKRDRDFIHQRYLNQMIFGPRVYWKDKALEEYNDFTDKNDVLRETKVFWKDVF